MSDKDLLSELNIDRGKPVPEGKRSWVMMGSVLGCLVTVLLLIRVYPGQNESPEEEGNDQSAILQDEVNQTTFTDYTPVVEESSQTPGGEKILDASGYVVAMRIATVSSKTVGRVEEVLVEEGMIVTSGQVLARLDSVSQYLQLEVLKAGQERAEAFYAESSAKLNEARLALSRMRTLETKGFISTEQLDNARIQEVVLAAEQERYLAEIGMVEREILLQQYAIDETVIQAPFSGVVTQKNAQAGEIISPSSSAGGFTRTGICTIVDMASLEIEVDVNESYINRVFIGQLAQATLNAYPDWHIPAQVLAIVPTANRQRATIKVRVKFQQLDPRILPDMGVNVSFFSEPAAEGA